MRTAIFIHVAAVAMCAALSLVDRGALVSHGFSLAVHPYAGILLLPTMVVWVTCPIVAVVAASGLPRPNRQVMLAVVTEALLCLAQLVAFFPDAQ